MNHPYGRKQRGTKEPLDEGERGEWKSWLKSQHSKNEDHGIWSHHFMANRRGNNGNSDRFYFLGLQITVDGDFSHEIKRCLLLGRKGMTSLDSILKSRNILPIKAHLVKAMVFPVVMYGCESWTVKKAERWRIDRSWVFIGRTDAEAETSILWPPDVKSWHIGKDPDAGKDWRQEEKGTTEDEKVRWHLWLNGNELVQAPGVGNGQESLACCSPWGCKESDMTEWLNWTEVWDLSDIDHKATMLPVFKGLNAKLEHSSRKIILL